MNRAILAVALASAGFFSAVAVQPLLAQQTADAPAETRADALARADARFDQMDTNKDGKLSPDEVAASRGPGRRGPAPASDSAPPAGAPNGGPGSRMFARMDANGDGVIDREEYREIAARRFDMMDTNKDGKIDAAERDAARDAMGNRMGRGQRGGTPGGDMPPPPAPNPNAGQ
jgi:Ca2+-binding EF-hand superfamily protein